MKEKNLRDYLEKLDKEGLVISQNMRNEDMEKTIKHISYNSMDVKPGTLFICKGEKFKAQYLKDAIEKGAVCYIAEKELVDDFPSIIVNNIRKAITDAAAFYYDSSWNGSLDVVGITGTKGKSTTSVFVKSILDSYCDAKKINKAGFVSGIFIYDGEKTSKEANLMTTPETLELYHILNKCVERDCKYAVVETSSQALKYLRTEAIEYKVGCLLNIGVDHISYNEHPNMEDYISSKMKIFDKCEIACINLDMGEEYVRQARREAAKCKKIVEFSIKENAYYTVKSSKFTADSMEFEAVIGDRTENVRLSMGGKHNISNALAAIAITDSMGIPFKYIKEGLASAKAAGRMEMFRLPDKKVDIIVDYAHNKMSYQAVIDSAKEFYPDRKILFLLGCVGSKAKNRRKEAGEIADKEADKVIITESWGFGEDPMQVCKEIRSHISENKDAQIIIDRAEAVRHALNVCGDNWVVLLTGFGISDYSALTYTKEKLMSDIKVVEEYIEEHRQ